MAYYPENSNQIQAVPDPFGGDLQQRATQSFAKAQNSAPLGKISNYQTGGQAIDPLQSHLRRGSTDNTLNGAVGNPPSGGILAGKLSALRLTRNKPSCPNCGYCPCCGRSNTLLPSYPPSTYPSYPQITYTAGNYQTASQAGAQQIN